MIPEMHSRLEWGGGIDFVDGSLQKQHNEYLKRVALVKGISRQLPLLHFV